MSSELLSALEADTEMRAALAVISRHPKLTNKFRQEVRALALHLAREKANATLTEESSIEALRLTRKVENVLWRANFRTIGGLRDALRREIKIPGIGSESLLEIRKKLKAAGFRL